MTHAASRDYDEPIVPNSAESAEAGRIVDFFSRQNVTDSPKLVGDKGEEMQLPVMVYHVLQRVAQEMAQGNAVAVLPIHHELTTTQSANILGVSRPHLVKLIEDGELPAHMVGTHRRVRLGDLLGYKHRRDGARRETLRRLTRDSQDIGLDF